MKNARLLIVLSALSFLYACGPMAAAGFIGNVINRTADNNEENQDITSSQPTPVYDREKIAESNLTLGIEYMQLGEYRLAMEKMQRAKIAKPDYFPTYNALGLLYQKLGKFEEAEKNFRYALELSPDNSSSLNNYGQFLCLQGRLEEAEQKFLMAADNPVYKTPEVPYANIGICAYKNNNEEKAEDNFQKALTMNPKIPVVLVHMSEIKYNTGNYLSAHDYLKRYLSISKHTPKSLWLGIRIERELGNKDLESSYALLLRNKYPDSSEALLLKNSVANN